MHFIHALKCRQRLYTVKMTPLPMLLYNIDIVSYETSMNVKSSCLKGKQVK